MAITDIISEQFETDNPNMEITQGGPEDFMTDDEMDPYQDPEFQQLLDSLPGDQAEVLMQLIKEFKMAVAQGFKGEFEDFVKMKMASAQGSPEDLMTEEEMIIPDEELQSMVPMGQQVAHGGRIGYQNAGPVGGIMDVVAEEQVETGPTTQQIIIKWLNDRGLPITPENIQRAIMEMSREGQAPSMTRRGMEVPQMEMPRPPTGRDYVPEELIGQDITETVTPDVAEMIPRAKPEVVEDVEDVEEAGIMQTDDPILYDDDDRTRWLEKGERLKSYRQGVSPDSYIWMMDEWTKEGRQKGWVPEENYLNYQKRFLGEGGEQLTDRINKYRENKGLNFAHGGRAGYGLGSLVSSVFKGVKSAVKGLTKSVKKFAKSDLGKLALTYLATAGVANIGAGAMGQPWLKGGAQWLRPSNVFGLGETGWGNIGKSFTNLGLGTGTPKATTSLNYDLGVGDVLSDTQGILPGTDSFAERLAAAGKSTLKGDSVLSKLGTSFKTNPFPWILGTAGAAGLYTAANPGEDNLDELMRNYKGEVKDWDDMIADIRAGRGPTTPFSTENITYPYPDYYKYSAEGGRVGRAEGGLMDLGGMEKDYRQEGGFVPLGGKEKADDVPARLSRNEFVFTADAVRNAGGGDVDRGSEVMQNIMTNLEQGGNISEESQGLEGARDMFEVSERLSEVV
jgi:hypothetical protein